MKKKRKKDRCDCCSVQFDMYTPQLTRHEYKGFCLCDACHLSFHHVYGSGEAQYEEFKILYRKNRNYMVEEEEEEVFHELFTILPFFTREQYMEYTEKVGGKKPTRARLAHLCEKHGFDINARNGKRRYIRRKGVRIHKSKMVERGQKTYHFDSKFTNEEITEMLYHSVDQLIGMFANNEVDKC